MAEESVPTELGPESKGLLEKLADKLQQGKEASDEVGAAVAGVTTAIDMSAITIAAASTTGLSAVRSTLGTGFSLIKDSNLSTAGAIGTLTDVMGSGLASVGKTLAGILHTDKLNLKLGERARKLAKTTGDALQSGIGTAAKKVGGIAKSILDLFLEGAFLLALYGLMKYLEGPGFKFVLMVYDYIKVVTDWIGTLFTDPLAALEQLWNGASNGIATVADWIWENTFVPLWDWFSDTFPGAAGVIEKLWNSLVKVAGNIGDWIYSTALEPVYDWFVLLFDDPVKAFDQLFDGIMNLGTWLWDNAIWPLWNWFKTLFTDPKQAFVELFAGYMSMGKWIYDNAIWPLWEWFEETFPDGAAFIKESWAKFMDTEIGQWIYNKVIEPFTKWLDLAFVNPEAALDEAWTFFESASQWLYDTILDPFWKWISKLFTDPTTALDESFTFFTSIGDWIFTNALEPFWKWFKDLFPDVAASLEGFWNTLTAPEGEYVEEPGIMGVIMGMLRGAWQYISGLMDFTSMEGLVSSAINLFFLPLNLITGFVGDIWDTIKGFFGFTKEEAKLPEDFSIGKFVTEMIGKLWGWVRNLMGFGDDVEANEAKMKDLGLGDGLAALVDRIVSWFKKLFDIDIAALGKSILGDSLYAFLFGDEEAEILAKQKEIEMHKKEMAEGDMRDWKGTKRENMIRVLEEEIAELNAEMLSKKNAKGTSGLEPGQDVAKNEARAKELGTGSPAAGGGAAAPVVITNNVNNGGNVQNQSSQTVGLGLSTTPSKKLVIE